MKYFARMLNASLLSLCFAFPAVAADAPQARPADAPVLAHIHIYCTQLEPMIEFWVQAFDGQLTLRRKFGNDDGAVVNLGASPLLYIQQIKVDGAKSDIAAYDHVGLNVGDIEAALKKALAAPGAKLDRGVAPSGKALTAFVRGPEGIRVELVQPPKP